MNVNGKYIKDENGNVISPVTSAKTVFDSNNQSLDSVISSFVRAEDTGEVGEIICNSVVSNYSEKTTDAYSCSYLNPYMEDYEDNINQLWYGLSATRLFSQSPNQSASTSSVTLSQSKENFKFLEFYYTEINNKVDIFYTKMFITTGTQYVQLGGMLAASTSVNFSARYKVSGTSVTVETGAVKYFQRDYNSGNISGRYTKPSDYACCLWIKYTVVGNIIVNVKY